MTSVPNITLNNGIEIPQLGFGVYLVPPEDAKETVLTAFEVGYRHIDTAQMYGNEEGVGQAFAESGLARDEVFITSKLNNGFHARADALQAIDDTLERLGMDQVDLFLIHWPMPGNDIDFVETWKAMEQIYADGKARAIGVSNFLTHHVKRLVDETDMVPAANQIEGHPYLQQQDVRALCADLGIAVEPWSPIAQGQVLDDAVVLAVASEVGRTPAQVVLRWHIQRGDIVFPKSMSRDRMVENFGLFDFELDAAQMDRITGLERDGRVGPDPDTFNWIPKS